MCKLSPLLDLFVFTAPLSEAYSDPPSPEVRAERAELQAAVPAQDCGLAM